ncbi:MAG: efflux RND transporter periplasmic adaptor subunit [Muribaculaceae bacterium]|nr:efflux RND transporter periplasmic adaptor subunit [Muribaculaceae bacterium]
MKRFTSVKLGAVCWSSSLLTILLSSCGGSQNQQNAMPPVVVQTITIRPQVAVLNESFPVTIKGKADIDIRPQVSGFITKVLVDEGQVVKKGQPLFEIDKVQFEAAVRSAEAAVTVANSQVAQAKLTADNKETLFNKGIISDYEYRTAKLALDAANAQLGQANAALVNARKNLSYATVVAPSNGVVGSIPNREGSLASPSTALTTVSDNSDVYAYFSFNEKQVVELTNGGTKTLNEAIATMPEVTLMLADGVMYPLKGKVSTVSGVLDSATGSATVRAIFPNTNSMLRSGSTGKVLIPQTITDAIVIPQKATYEVQDRKYVYLLNDSCVATSQPVTINPISDGKEYVVTSGLKPGDVVVTEGVGITVREGSKVTPADKAVTATQAQ